MVRSFVLIIKQSFICREQDKAAKLAAKEEVKQARDRDKMENRASKGDALCQQS